MISFIFSGKDVCNMEKLIKSLLICLLFFGNSILLGVESRGKVQVSENSATKSLSQIIIPFKTNKEYNYYLDESSRCLTLSFKDTQSKELPSFTGYDSSLISKVLIKEYVASTTDVLIYLKDDDVEVSVYDFNSPFRVVIDTFKSKDTESVSVDNNSPESLPIQNYGLLLNNSGEKKRHTTFDQLSKLLRKYSDGIKNVGEFPRYVYRFEPIEKDRGFSRLEELESTPDTRLDSDIVDEYGKYFYSIGSELKALATMGYLLKIDPMYVNKRSDLVWIIAESTFRGGNPAVAGGYYDIMSSANGKTQVTALYVALSCIRKADLLAMKKDYSEAQIVLESCKTKNPKLFTSSKKEDTYDLRSYYLIRKAYLDNQTKSEPSIVPLVNSDLYKQLISLPSDYIPEHNLYSKDMDQFLVSSLILNYMLEQKWQGSNSRFVANYFRAFGDSIYEPEYSYLRDKLKNKLISEFNTAFENREYSEVVNIYEGLDKSLQSISKTPKISWILAESYRFLGQNEKASLFYSQTSKDASSTQKFQSSYRQLISSATYQKGSRLSSLDSSTYILWKDLTDKEKNSLGISMKSEFKSGVLSNVNIKTPALVYLDLWVLSLEKGRGPYSEDGSTSSELSSLASKFESLGLRPEKKKTLELMLKLKTDTMRASDRSDLTEDLISLAEEYRSQKDFEKSATSYIKVAEVSTDGKASFLYKGSLMYLQAGMNKEAHTYLTECSNYNDDKYYANLCKERLEKLNN